MLHIYRQISALKRVSPVVIAQKRENADAFPFDPVHVVSKPLLYELRRFWFRTVLDQPWKISRREVDVLLSVLDRTSARLLHIYFGHIAVHLLPLIRAWPQPTIVSFHGADVLVDLTKPAYRAATAEMLKTVRAVFVRSESLQRALIDIGADGRKIQVQRAGIPLDQFPFRTRTFPEDGNWRLLQSGRLIEKKGIDTTLRAFATFARQYPNSILTLAGEGPLLSELQTLAQTLRLENRVSFTGFISQDELRALLYRSHIFVHPSEMGRDGNQEGIPNAMLEAMATGLPVFATNHGGIPEAIEDGISGVLVPERDHEALAGALIDAAQDPDRLLRLGQAASEAVSAKFDQRVQVRRLEDSYLEIISRGD